MQSEIKEKIEIEKYLNSLPIYIDVIDLSNKNIYKFPDLSRFYNLKKLILGYNKIISVKDIPDSLEELWIDNNSVTKLPKLRSSLRVLYYNKLTDLPPLNIVDDDDLDDETWISNKREFWRKNNISPLKIKGGDIKPEELTKLLQETFYL